MMPYYHLICQAPLDGPRVDYWTQDPEGMADHLRAAGWFVSRNVEREDPPIGPDGYETYKGAPWTNLRKAIAEDFKLAMDSKES